MRSLISVFTAVFLFIPCIAAENSCLDYLTEKQIEEAIRFEIELYHWCNLSNDMKAFYYSKNRLVASTLPVKENKIQFLQEESDSAFSEADALREKRNQIISSANKQHASTVSSSADINLNIADLHHDMADRAEYNRDYVYSSPFGKAMADRSAGSNRRSARTWENRHLNTVNSSAAIRNSKVNGAHNTYDPAISANEQYALKMKQNAKTEADNLAVAYWEVANTASRLQAFSRALENNYRPYFEFHQFERISRIPPDGRTDTFYTPDGYWAVSVWLPPENETARKTQIHIIDATTDTPVGLITGRKEAWKHYALFKGQGTWYLKIKNRKSHNTGIQLSVYEIKQKKYLSAENSDPNTR